MGGFDGFSQGLGNVVGVLAAIESLRSPGGLSNYFANRLEVQGNPDTRAGLVGSPFTAGFFGVPGGRQLSAVDMPNGDGGPTPSAPERQMLWQPQLPPIGPNMQLKQEAARTSIDLDKAHLNALNHPATAFDFGKLLGGGAGGMEVTGLNLGPDGQPRSVTLAVPNPITVPAGATVAGGPIPAKIGNRSVITKPDTKQNQAAQVRDEQVANAQAVLDVIPALRDRSQELLYSPAGDTFGAAGQAAGNYVKGKMQENITVPNALRSGQAPEFQTAVQKIIPLIRAAAVGTKGLRITNTAFEREGGPLTNPQKYSAPEMKAYLDKVEQDMSDIVNGKSGSGSTTSTPTADSTTTTQPLTSATEVDAIEFAPGWSVSTKPRKTVARANP